jgi:hypothetical protein
VSGPGKRPWWAWGCSGSATPTDLRNLGRFNLWLLVWAVSFGGATYLLSRHIVPPGLPGYALAGGSTLLGVVALGSYVVFLRAADELQRKIQLDALAIAFGVGVVFMNGYRLLEHAGAPRLEVSDPLLPMLAAWVVAQFWGLRRYR